MSKNKVIVVGAGPAGMMSAITASENGADVTIIEKNQKVGRKLLITGKGRCNITNFCDADEFIANVPTNPRFLYSAINSFSTYDTIAFFESLGVASKVERGNRVFPVSDKAVDVVDAMYNKLLSSGCKLVCDEVSSLIFDNESVRGVTTTLGNKYFADKVIVTCGGKSYPRTGSTGSGYKLAKSIGHTVTDIIPSLVPLLSNDDFCPILQGLSLRNVGITVVDNNSNKEIYTDFGEMLFTHFGISGPTILSASAHMRNMTSDKYSIFVDLKPALSNEMLDKRLLKDFSKYINKDICNSLFELLPKSIIPVILNISGIDPHTKCNSVTAGMRRKLLDSIKNFRINISGFAPIEEAIITSGGVCVDQIHPKTMQSKLLSGVYFAGEVIDTDAYTGGFNLQIAFSTGYLAGISAAIS